MELQNIYQYLAYCGLLTIVLWVPYVIARTGVTGLIGSQTYTGDFPRTAPELPAWAARSQRAHMNMIETMAAFVPVTIAAVNLTPTTPELASIALWAMVFFWARIVHAIVYTAGIPFARTPAYFASWLSVIMIGLTIFS